MLPSREIKIGVAALIVGAIALSAWPTKEDQKSEVLLEALPNANDKTNALRVAAPFFGSNNGRVLAVSRIPATGSSEGIAELQGASAQRWNIKKNADNYATKMTDGSLTLGADTPVEATKIFLTRFGRNALGFDPSSVGGLEVIQEESTAQVIVSQVLNGIPVYNARGNFIFDSDGNLIYLVSDVYRGPHPSAPLPAISSQHAALAAQVGLLHHLLGRGADPADYPVERFHGVLMYRLVGESISLVYRYELPLVEPLIGDMEIMIDAHLGVSVLMQNQTRK